MATTGLKTGTEIIKVPVEFLTTVELLQVKLVGVSYILSKTGKINVFESGSAYIGATYVGQFNTQNSGGSMDITQDVIPTEVRWSISNILPDYGCAVFSAIVEMTKAIELKYKTTPL